MYILVSTDANMIYITNLYAHQCSIENLFGISCYAMHVLIRIFLNLQTFQYSLKFSKLLFYIKALPCF